MSAHQPQQSPATKSGNLNALKHGCTSQKLILPDENQADFDALLNSLIDEYQPELQHHRIMVEQVAVSQWFVLRRQRALIAIEAALYAEKPGLELWTDDDHHRLELADRHRTQAERSLTRALQNVELIRKNRRSQLELLERQDRWRAEQDLRKRRLELAKERFESQQKAAQTSAGKEEEEEPEPPRRWPQARIPTPTKLSAYGILYQKQAQEKLAQQAKAKELAQTRTEPEEPGFVS
jgi:hypothetical protein